MAVTEEWPVTYHPRSLGCLDLSVGGPMDQAKKQGWGFRLQIWQIANFQILHPMWRVDHLDPLRIHLLARKCSQQKFCWLSTPVFPMKNRSIYLCFSQSNLGTVCCHVFFISYHSWLATIHVGSLM